MSRLPKLQASWLKLPHCLLAAEALGDDHIRFVGGAVRNSLMGVEVSDIDVATTHYPEKATALMQAKGFKVIPTGIDHGTITAVLDGEVLEVTTLRHDVETDGRRAKVAFTNEWSADAARRDFTMNAIYATIDGTLFDPFGGIDDIKAGRVRFIGKADERIKEDALRILRLFRFQTYFGRVPLDESDLATVKADIVLLKGLSMERIASELLKMLKAPRPCLDLEVMKSIGVFEVIFPGSIPDIRSLEVVMGKGLESTVSLRNLLALFQHDAPVLGQKLRLSNKQCAHLSAAWSVVREQHALEEIKWKECIYRYGRSIALDALLLTHSDVDDDFFETLNAWDIPTLPIKGKDIVGCGVVSGPEVGHILAEKEALWIASDFKLLKTDLLMGVTP